MTFTLTPNRLSKAIKLVEAKHATLSPEKQAEVDASLAIDFEEHFTYQQTQALAHASGWITPDEAQIMYTALGEVGCADNGGWAQGASTATKFVVTKAVGELIAKKHRL